MLEISFPCSVPSYCAASLTLSCPATVNGAPGQYSITAEALAIYRRHVKSGGIIAFHVTNRYLDLVPVVQELADAAGLHAVLVADDGEEPMGSRSDWVLLSDSETRLEAEPIEEAEEAIEPRAGLRLWTDDFNNIVQVLKRDD